MGATLVDALLPNRGLLMTTDIRKAQTVNGTVEDTQ
jgi:hypothetical protein